jgi:hypothetical protein
MRVPDERAGRHRRGVPGRADGGGGGQPAAMAGAGHLEVGRQIQFQAPLLEPADCAALLGWAYPAPSKQVAAEEAA